MGNNIEKSVLDNIAEKASFIAEMEKIERKREQFAQADGRCAYLNGMAYVLEMFGYIFQYKDDTHIFIDTIENVVNKK